MPAINRKKTRIISIRPYPPAYELFWNDSRPEVNWDTYDGQWVGIWDYGWANLVANEVLKITDTFECEIWQPDLRADKIYSHKFDNGVTHKLFPAVSRRRLFGLKLVNEVVSPVMNIELPIRTKSERVILHLNGEPMLHHRILSAIDGIPSILTFHGTIQLPSVRLSAHTRNIPSKLNHAFDHIWLRQRINNIKIITYQNDMHLESLKKIYKGKVEKITMGCDFSFWRPGDSMRARAKMGLPAKKKIFLTASRLAAGKQIDRLIDVFAQLSRRHDFLLFIAGHGEKTYEDRLKKHASELTTQGKLVFGGFVRGEHLRNLYQACDYYIMTSMAEGASVSVMNAFACGVPVISTRTGHTAELMEQYRCGCLLDVYDCSMWYEELDRILRDQKSVLPLDRTTAKRFYDWPNVAGKFVGVYESLVSHYYGN